MTSWLCRLGLHRWAGWRTTLFVNVRVCLRCNRREHLDAIAAAAGERERWKEVVR